MGLHLASAGVRGALWGWIWACNWLVWVSGERSGAGFVDYKWPQAGFEEPVAKISYVKGFAPWGWVIGAPSPST